MKKYLPILRLIRKIFIIFIAFCLVINVLIKITGQANASTFPNPITEIIGADGYPYPDMPCEYPDSKGNFNTQGKGYWCQNFDWGTAPHFSGENDQTDPSLNSPYGYGYRNCTDYVAWKISQVFPAIKFPTTWGAAYQWKSNAQNTAGYTVENSSSYTPQQGDIAGWGTEVAGGFGHVAYVANVTNGIATFDEYNAKENGNFTNTNTSAQDHPDWYIHIGTPTDVNPTPSTGYHTVSGQIIQRSSGIIDVFAVNTLHQLAHRTLDPNSGWSSWEILGSGFTTTPVALQRSSGIIDVFAVNTLHQLAHRTLNPNSGWSSWEILGSGFTTTPVALQRSSGIIDVFAVNTLHQLAHRTLNPNSGWSSWEILGSGFTTTPVALQRSSGIIDVFAVNTLHQLAHRTLDTNFSWSSWEILGSGFTTTPVALQRSSGIIDVFAVNTLQQLAHRTLDTNFSWSSWEILGSGFTTTPVAMQRSSGIIDVFAVNTLHQLAHRTLDTNFSWSSWEILGSGFTTTPVAMQRSSGIIDVFAVNTLQQLAHRTLDTNFSWSSWEILGSGIVLP